MAIDDSFRARLDTMIDMRHSLAVLMRDARRGLELISQGVAGHEPTALAIAELMMWLGRAERIRTQQRHSKSKLRCTHPRSNASARARRASPMSSA